MNRFGGKNIVIISVLSLLLLLTSLGILYLGSEINADCTIISFENQQMVFANNEDYHFKDLVVGFYPATTDTYGSIHFGYRDRSGNINYQGVVNEAGLSWDVNSIPKSRLNPHPERRFSHLEDNYLTAISKYVTTVADAIELSMQFDFGDNMESQIHIADASGDAVIISPGDDGELAYTRKLPGESYLISTNFNRAEGIAKAGWRYETAQVMLEEFDGEDPVAYAGEVLEAVSLNNITTFTIYSNVNDLTNGKVYLYYMSVFENPAIIDVDHELAKGQRIIEMKELFPASTVEKGDEAYMKFERKFFLTIGGAITAAVAMITGIVLIVRKKIMKSK